jgi:hypothetical protein
MVTVIAIAIASFEAGVLLTLAGGWVSRAIRLCARKEAP